MARCSQSGMRVAAAGGLLAELVDPAVKCVLEHRLLRPAQLVRPAQQPHRQASQQSVRRPQDPQRPAQDAADAGQLQHFHQPDQRLVEAAELLAVQIFTIIALYKLVAAGLHDRLPALEGVEVAPGHAQQVGHALHEKAVGADDVAAAGGGRRTAKHGHLIQQRNPIFRGLASRVEQLGRFQERDGDAADHAGRHPRHDFLLKVGEQRRGVGLAHFGDDDDDRLAGLQDEPQEPRRHFVVVALVGRHENHHVGQGDGFEEARDVAGRRPGGHVGAVPHDKVFEEVVSRRIGRDAADLIHVLVQTGGRRLREAPEWAEEAEVAGPGKGAGDAGVGDGMAGETGLGVGLRRLGAAEHVGDRALAGPRAADDGDVQRDRRLVVDGRADAVAHQCRGQPQTHRRRGLVGLPAAVLLQPAEVVGQLPGQRSGGQWFHVQVFSPRSPHSLR